MIGQIVSHYRIVEKLGGGADGLLLPAFYIGDETHSPKGSEGLMNKYMTRRSWLGAAATFAASGVAAGQEDFTKLPPNLPVPMDDGACDHHDERRIGSQRS